MGTRYIASKLEGNYPLQAKRLHTALLEAELKHDIKRPAFGGGNGYYPHITDLVFEDITFDQYVSEYGVNDHN